MKLNDCKKILNTEAPASDKFATALYSLIDRVCVKLGYKFPDWEDVRQNIICKLYEKTIPALNGSNNYALLASKVHHLLIDSLRRQTTRNKRFTPLTEGMEATLEFKEQEYMSDEELKAFFDELEKDGDLDEKQVKKVARLKSKLLG